MDAQAILSLVVGAFAACTPTFWIVIKWLAPRVDKLFTAITEFVDRLKTQHIILERYAAVTQQLANVVAEQQTSLTKGRWLTLIVDDSAISRHTLWSICEELSKDFKLVVKDVDCLADVYEHLAYCSLIILDVMMRDCDEETANAFISAAKPCDVIIYTGTIESQAGAEKFPEAKAVIGKTTTFEETLRIVKSVLAKQRKEGK